jgi:hypothetical protein
VDSLNLSVRGKVVLSGNYVSAEQAKLGTKMKESKVTGPGANVMLQAHCKVCNKTVRVSTLLNRSDLVVAIQSGRDVRVMHAATEGDHIWSLNSQDEQNLSSAIAKGFV